MDQLHKDIGRKCADDVSDAIRRGFQLVENDHGAVIVAAYAAAAAFGAAGGAFAAYAGKSPDLTADSIDDLWAGFIRPMMLGQLIATTPARAATEEGK